MTKLDTDTKKYLSCVKRELSPYSFALKKKAMHTLANDLLTFGADVPGANYEQICNQFGHPDRFADGLLDAVEPEELRKSTRKKSTLTWLAVSFLVLMLIASTWNFIKIFDSKVTHTVETAVYVEE